eukprot:EG_transcript_15115
MSARRSLNLADQVTMKADKPKGPPKRLDGGSPKVNVGQEGETVKQVVVFSADQPVEPASARVRGAEPATRSPSNDLNASNPQAPRRSSLKPTLSPTAVVRGGFDLPSPSAPLPTSAGPAQWLKGHSKELPEGTARLMPLYDISAAAGQSCARAVELLEQLGRAWPHDYAVCFSGSTHSFWLLIRVGRQPDIAEAVRSHQVFASVMQSLPQSSGSSPATSDF